MEKRTALVINPAGRITRVRPSEVAHILKKNPEIRRCTPEEIEAFTAGAALPDNNEKKAAQTAPAATAEERLANLCKALKKEQMLEVIDAFELEAPPANATKDGLAAIILDKENGYETAMSYAAA